MRLQPKRLRGCLPFTTIQLVGDIKIGHSYDTITVSYKQISVEYIIAISAGEHITTRGQCKGFTGVAGRYFLVVGHGEGGTLGDFAFTLSAVGQVVFQNGHAVVGNSLHNNGGSPVSTHGDSLGSKIGVGIKCI